MNILFIGDVVGRPGRRAVHKLLPSLRQQYRIDLVIANGENVAGGAGITPETARELFDAGIDFITTGNHVWDHKEAFSLLENETRIIRPINYPPGCPGQGYALIASSSGASLGIINASGRAFLPNLDCPFRSAAGAVDELKERTEAIIIDFHAEATSEKLAFAWFMDGKVSAVIGTHTHVQTNDARILPHGTAFITDVGMTGPRDSILGVKVEPVVAKFLTELPQRFEVAKGVVELNAVVIEIFDDKCQARRIVPLRCSPDKDYADSM